MKQHDITQKKNSSNIFALEKYFFKYQHKNKQKNKNVSLKTIVQKD